MTTYLHSSMGSPQQHGFDVEQPQNPLQNERLKAEEPPVVLLRLECASAGETRRLVRSSCMSMSRGRCWGLVVLSTKYMFATLRHAGPA